MMETGPAKRWLPPTFIFICILCLFFAGSRLNSSARAEAELQTGLNSGILVAPVQLDRDSYGLAMVDTSGKFRPTAENAEERKAKGFKYRRSGND